MRWRPMASTNFIQPVFNSVGSTVAGDLVTWNNATGSLVADSGKLASAVVTGPVSTTVGDVAVWNNASGTLLADSSLSVTSAAGTTTVQTTATNPTLIVAVPRQTSGAGNNATHQAGGAQSGGTNLAGGDIFIGSGITTGTGRSNVRLQTPSGASASGTSDNAVIDRLVLAGNLALTSGVATTIVTPTVGAGQLAGGMIMYSLRVTGGTSDLQNESSMVFYSVVNKAASVTRSTTQSAPCQASTAGTLTTSWSVTAAGLVQVTATTSLSTPLLNLIYEIHNQSFGVITF